MQIITGEKSIVINLNEIDSKLWNRSKVATHSDEDTWTWTFSIRLGIDTQDKFITLKVINMNKITTDDCKIDF